MGKFAYLDNAGAALYCEEQMKMVFEDLKNLQLGNPHSRNSASKQTADLVDQARYRVLEHLNTNADEYSVIFTSGATAALKLLAESFDFHAPGKGEFHQHDPFSPFFAYLNDNHTSVIGMREIVKNRAKASIFSVKADEMAGWMKNNPTFGYPRECNSLFVYPSQSNFCGRKYALEWISELQQRRSYVCLDAASHLSTNRLHLDLFKPDFLVLSFYKIFGYPTGLGALIVKNSSAHVLKKEYFGGGTVDVSLPGMDFHRKRSNLIEKFEDGTIDYLSIISLKRGFQALQLVGGIEMISSNAFQLARTTYNILKTARHGNGSKICEFYTGPKAFESSEVQSGIIAFNLLRDDGTYVGFTEVEKMADLYCIQLRTGCFCNQGACQQYLGLTDEDIMGNFKQGKVCGDTLDLIKGKPVGAIRISFGWTSTPDDVLAFLGMIYDCFISAPSQTFAQLTANVGSGRTSLEIEPHRNPSSSYSKEKQIVLCEPFDGNSGGQQTSNRRLTDIAVYPLKSAQAIQASDWPISTTGLLYDRLWMAADENGLTLTQKRAPQLCAIKPKISEDFKTVYFQAPGFEDLQILPLQEEDSPRNSKVCSDRVETVNCGQSASDWISAVTNQRNAEILKQTDSRINPDSGSVSLANVAQYLLVNRTTVRKLLPLVRSAYPEMSEDDLVGRFRANLVVETGKEEEENNWEYVYFGSHTFKVIGKCQRCQMICINQTSGEKDPKILTALRDMSQGTMTFGVYLQHIPSNEDSNHLLSTRDEMKVKLYQ